jgi:hypothetical protein
MWMGLVMVLCTWSGPLVDGHVHKAPHAGVIVHSGPYHLELVVQDLAIQVWLLDQAERVVRPPADASLVLTFDRPVKGRIRFKAGQNGVLAEPGTNEVALVLVGDRFQATFTLERVVTTGFTAQAELRVGAKIFKSAFRWTPLDATHRLDDRLKL